MNMTNIYNLPPAIVAAIRKYQAMYKPTGDITVTSLAKSPKQYILKKLHHKDLVTDASDHLQTFFGSLIHKIIEESTDNVLNKSEVRLTIDVLGWKVSGMPDNLCLASGTLDDYKTGKVYGIIKGIKAEHIWQVNVYAYMLRKEGYIVNKLRLVYLLKDWSKTTLRKDRKGDYPENGIVTREVEIKSDNEIEEYLERRVKIHQEGKRLYLLNKNELDLPDCTGEERWSNGDVYAVMKVGGKQACRGGIFQNKQCAENFLVNICIDKSKNNKGNYYVEERLGEDINCIDYCAVKGYCEYWKEKYGDAELDIVPF